MRKNKLNTTKKRGFFRTIGRVVPYLAAAALVFGIAKVGSEDKNNVGAASINMNAMSASNSVSADQLSELYMVASISSSFSLASTDVVSGNYVMANVLKDISQTSTDRIEKPGYVAVSYSPGIETYIVSEGETMDSIAARLSAEYRTQLTTDQIRWSNGLKTTDVYVGQTLSIPKTAGIVYTVKTGDTPESLASRYGAQADRIISYNNLEDTGLVNGMSIVLPGGSLPLTERPEYVPVYNYSYYGATSDRQDLTRVYEPVTNAYGNPMAWGQCTYYVWWKRGEMGMPLDKNAFFNTPTWNRTHNGDARNWAAIASEMGMLVDNTPSVGAIFQTPYGTYGHVGIVLRILDDGSLIVREMNYLYMWNVITESTIPANIVGNFNYIH